MRNGGNLPSSVNCTPEFTSCLGWWKVTINHMHRDRFRLREAFVEIPHWRRKRHGVCKHVHLSLSQSPPKIQVWTREKTRFWDSPWARLHINVETSSGIKLYAWLLHACSDAACIQGALLFSLWGLSVLFLAQVFLCNQNTPMGVIPILGHIQQPAQSWKLSLQCKHLAKWAEVHL